MPLTAFTETRCSQLWESRCLNYSPSSTRLIAAHPLSSLETQSLIHQKGFNRVILWVLLFCLTIHDILKNLRSEFGVFYLDDGTLGGSLDEVLGDVQIVKRAAGDMGLQLNHEKLEIICDDPSTRDSMLSAFSWPLCGEP